MALCVQHTTYHHLKQRQIDRQDYRDPFVEMIDVIAGRAQQPAKNGDGRVARRRGLPGQPARRAPSARRCRSGASSTSCRPIRRRPTRATRASSAASRASATRCSRRRLQDLLAGAQDFDLYRIFGACRDLAGGLVTAAPVFFAADHFGKQEQQVRRRLGAVDRVPARAASRAPGGVQRLARAGRRRLGLVQALRQTRRAPPGARC